MASESLIGPLPDSWRVTTLGEACKGSGGDIQTGPFGSQLHAADYVTAGIPSIMPQNIGDNRVLEAGIARITRRDAARLSRYRVRMGDIVYSRRGDVEKRALIREQEDGWLCGTGCLRIRFGKSDVDPAYASYYLGHPQVRAWITQHAHGATMPNLNTAILSETPFVVPPYSEQRRLAGILGTLDDKIELNHLMSQTLESLVRAAFEASFGGEQPISSLGQMVELVREQVRPFERPDQQFEHYSIPAFDAAGLPVRELGEQIRSPKWRLVGNEVLLSKLNPDIERVWLPDVAVEANAVCSTEFLVLRPIQPATRSYLYCLLRSPAFRDGIRSVTSGTTGSRQRADPDAVLDLPVISPNRDKLHRFERTAGDLLLRAGSARRAAAAMVSIRTSLLPRLLSHRLSHG